MAMSTYVFDTAGGKPARGLRVHWDTLRDGEWAAAGHGATDDDGRIASWTTSGVDVGIHRLVFSTGEWFRGEGHESCFPEVVVLVEAFDAGEDHHVSLLLAPYGYTTYRGS